MPQNTNYPTLLIEKFLTNRATKEELDQLFIYIKEHPDDPVLHAYLKEYADAAHVLNRKLPDAISAELKAKLNQKIFDRNQSASHFKTHRLYWRIAAVFIPIAIFLSVVYVRHNMLSDLTIHTAFGEIKNVMLPDSSFVTLNANSTLSFAQHWDEHKPREVTLHGEGFFHVVHKKNNSKFLVHTSNQVTIEVLGTQFNVNDRRDITRVTLQSGKIKLGTEKKLEGEIFMQPGDYAEVTPLGRITKKTVAPHQYTAWKNNKLIFKDTPLSEIISILEDNYGYRAIVSDSHILRETFTATYPSENISILLHALSKSFKISVNEKEKKISIGL